jgi:hypothetical protein
MAENSDVRAAQDRVRQQVFDSGGEKAVRAAEKHIRATTPALEAEVRRRQQAGG